ncbi:MAG: valine--tRNA ligase [Bryobacteraceae bacterium]|nr:valine--tRNA ligase [Bryobacteraceae bacterium]MDW8380315.1 valine--tRNA ligase [Bryobacterales bacterium]
MDISQLPKHFDSKQAEEKWDRQWEEWGIYHYDPSRGREETYVIDTPPPTVSGSLHVGHVFSYTHTDLMARFQRMRGKNIFYPIGWDDNGLPTERRVQNYFNVRCDPSQPYVPHFDASHAADQKQPVRVSRPNFIELCLRLTAEDEKVFKALWRRVGLSVDWRQEYSTIDDRCRRVAQISFLDLFEKGHIYAVDSPAMWDVDFQTAVAQAEVEDRTTQGHFHHIRFQVEGSAESFEIATTRPELLAACVAVTAHPDDERYKPFFGRRAVTPVFQVPVPIFPSELADPEKGTGILMVCTFGDATDVRWWREQALPNRQIIGRDGRLIPIRYGEPGWESLNPDAANAAYAQIVHKNTKQARRIMVEQLLGDALTRPPQPIEHAVKYFEKGDNPLEFISTRQWFVRLLDKKEQLIACGDRIVWHPDFMRLRFKTWTEGLQFDWCISRQRYFGVPFPVWYPLNADGQPDYEHPILATREMLPVDPMSTPAPGYRQEQRDQPGGFTAETDVFDTWFTSSLTPQIVSGWETDPQLFRNLFPNDLRPQSHEIIRTWAFYTVVKAWLHSQTVPWKHVAISGWVLDPDRKKMSKSKGNVVTPVHLLDEYGADAVRYWSASARLGGDTAFDTNVLKIGKRLVTKLFNAGKFVLAQTAEDHPIRDALDYAFLAQLRQLVERTTTAFENYEHSVVLAETERFFWRGFTDNYLELVKARARSESDAAGRGSAVRTLRLALRVLLRLFAPFLPYITEEIWSWSFAQETGVRSVHRASWPSVDEFPAGEDHTDACFETAIAAMYAVNKTKSEAGVSVGRPVAVLQLACNRETAEQLKPALGDVLGAVRAQSCELSIREDLETNRFEIVSVSFAAFEEQA